MIKGITKRVIVVKSPDPSLFEEALFIVREDSFPKNSSSAADLLSEAQKIANGYTGSVNKKNYLSGLLYALGGAALTGFIWLLTAVI